MTTGERSSSILQHRSLRSDEVLQACGRRHHDHSLAQSEVRRKEVCCWTSLPALTPRAIESTAVCLEQGQSNLGADRCLEKLSADQVERAIVVTS